MDKIKIAGGGPLNGVIPISGAKNAALPLMIASLLTRDTLTLANMPLLADVMQLERILGNHGVDFAISGKRSGQSESAGRTVHFTARDIVDTTAPYELVSRMRASFLGFSAFGGAYGLSARVASRRLRNWHPTCRSSLNGDGKAWNENRN